MVINPLSAVAKADEKVDRRRERRALNEAELAKLLIVARCRPLAEYGRETVRKAPEQTEGRRTWTKRPLTLDTLDAALERARHALRNNPAFLNRLVWSGRERAIIYKTLVLTGLRKGELSSIDVGYLELDEPVAYIVLQAADDKSRDGAEIPLRADLADDLRSWLADKLRALQDDCQQRGEPIPSKLPASEPVFRVPRDLFKILDRDLRMAGIPKKDGRGRSIDVHALRHSFGTLLSRAGVGPRTAQAAMRHSTIDLTMNTYTNPRLLDVHGAIDALPVLPLDAGLEPDSSEARATGTDDATPLRFAPTPDNLVQSKSSVDKTDRDPSEGRSGNSDVVSLESVKEKQPVTTAVTGCSQERVRGFEPPTYSLGSCHSAS